MPNVEILDSFLFHVDEGEGRPVVFLHGNPTSSYIWRGVIEGLGEGIRSIAPDLIGMGSSGKPAIDYSFRNHTRYLDTWYDTLDLNDIVVVGHDWGGVLALDWARRHPDRVQGVVLLETILRSLSWDSFPEQARDLFEKLRTPRVGEDLVLAQNLLIERALPGTVATGLDEGDLEVYRAPYPNPEDRQPLLAWSRQLPIDGEPPEIVEIVEASARWLSSTDIPKLLLTFGDGPGTGAMVTPEVVEWCRGNLDNLEIQYCGVAGHQAPEDRAQEISNALMAWLSKVSRPEVMEAR